MKIQIFEGANMTNAFKEIREAKTKDLPQMIEVFNEVIEEGVAFPWEESLTLETGKEFFFSQDACRVAVSDDDEILAVAIVHPNAIGRSGHIANGSYAVSSKCRGQHIGDKLVRDSLEVAKNLGYRIMQFNAVVASNIHAQHLYERIGFEKVGCVEGGFRNVHGEFEDMFIYVYDLA